MSRPIGQPGLPGPAVGKHIARRPGPKAATAVLDSSVGKAEPKPLTISTTASPTKSLVIKSPPKPSILMRTRFRITGKVQGVFFRKFTQQKAVELSIFGWVENHEDGSVIGEAEGRLDKLVAFKHWLETKGSPKSLIEGASFEDESPVETRKYSRFDVVR
jgi:acylphosphatase